MFTRTRVLVAALALAIAAPSLPGTSGVAQAGMFERQVREAVGKIPRHKLRNYDRRKVREVQRNIRRSLGVREFAKPRKRGSWRRRK